MMPKKKKTSQQKVDLTERPAQGGAGDAQRRERAQTESSFGTDKLFDDDPQATPQGAATPNPEHKKPTIKGMKRKFAKTLGLSKGSSSSTTPSDDTSGARGSNSGSEQIPSLSSSPVMTHKASPRSPTPSDGVWIDPSVTTSPLADPLLPPLDNDSTVSSPGDKTVGSQEFTTTKEEWASRMERAAQRSRASGSVDTGKQLAHTNRLREQVKDLKKKLKAKNEELQTKLYQIDIEHQETDQQLKTANQEIDELKKQLEAHKEESKQKDVQIKKAVVLSQQVKRLQEENENLIKLDIQAMAKQQLSQSLSPTDSEGDELLVDQQDNRTDAEKLRDELEEVTRKAEQDAVTYRQQTKDLQTQVEDLVRRLNDATTSNVEFQEAIKISIEQAPPSAGGIQAGDEGDSAKLLQLIKGKYLEKVTEIVELKQRFDRKMSNLTEKIHEKDHQLKVQRDNRSRASVDDTDEDEESSIAELRATLRTKDQEIQSLTIQLQTFQQVASQRQQLQEHSKAQSTVVANLKKELAAAQRDLAKTQGVVSSLTGNSKPASQQVGTDERGMQLLTAEVNLCKIEREIEVKEHEKKVERLNSEVTELGKANLSLERRLRESNEERDVLSLQSVELLASKHSYKGQLDVTQEHLTQLTSTIMLKTEENEQLKEKLKTVEEELEITKFVVFQYQQDFEEERAARVQAIGAKDTEYGKFSMRVQTLSDQLRESKAEAETEKREKQAVIAKLETTLTEKQQLTKQLTQTEEDLDRTLATKLQEIREESTQLMAQMEHLRTESMKFQRQQQTAEATYERREAELVEDLVAIKQELSHTKQNCSRTATELQDARQRLKVSLADTECLHDEVMSKTAQVKQYKKQTDSFKAKMEEANTKLLKTQQELQRCQELINTMEMDSQDQNRERIDYLERTAVDRQSVISGLASNIRSQKQHIHQLEVEIEHQKEANGRLEARLERQDELAPYCVSQVLSLGQQEGSGSYGSIYLTQLNGINCVAKRVHDILLGHGNVEQLSLEDKRAAYKKFYSECVLLSRMRHPNIVQFMGVYYGPQRDYGRELTLVMERLYMNLYDCLHRYPNIEMWLKISILLDISQGLLHLHSQGIVHRDLTTPNVLLTTSFHAKIADLGVSKIIQVCGTKQTTAPGNPDYMPPEALTEIPTYGYALDIFSFGVIMLFVLTQKYPKPYEVPFTVTGVQRKEIQIQKRMKWISKLSPEDPMRQLICRCLQDDPQRRPLSQELNSTLIRFAQQFPKPFVDTIEMQRKCIPTTPPIPLPRRLSQGQQ